MTATFPNANYTPRPNFLIHFLATKDLKGPYVLDETLFNDEKLAIWLCSNTTMFSDNSAYRRMGQYCTRISAFDLNRVCEDSRNFREWLY